MIRRIFSDKTIGRRFYKIPQNDWGNYHKYIHDTRSSSFTHNAFYFQDTFNIQLLDMSIMPDTKHLPHPMVATPIIVNKQTIHHPIIPLEESCCLITTPHL